MIDGVEGSREIEKDNDCGVFIWIEFTFIYYVK